MSPKKAGRVTAHARSLLAQRVLSRCAFLTLESMMWGLGRAPFTDEVIASYSDIQAATAMRRQCVADAIAQLVELGLIQKFKRSILVQWRHGKQWRQLATRYRILLPPDCESGRRTVLREATSLVRKHLVGMAKRMAAKPQAPRMTPEEQIAYCLQAAAETRRKKEECSGEKKDEEEDPKEAASTGQEEGSKPALAARQEGAAASIEPVSTLDDRRRSFFLRKALLRQSENERRRPQDV